MAVFRVIKDKENPYVMLNKYFVYDGRLSLKAKGLMSYFLSRPDNWKFYSSEIEKNCKDGEKAIRTAIKELENNGYIERLLKRDSNGKLIGGYDYTIFEIPQNIKSDETTCTKEEPKRQNAYSAKCLSGETPIRRNGGLLNNDIKLNNDINSSSNSNKGNIEVFKHFEKCNFGLPSPMLIEKIAVDIEIYSKEWVMKAAEISDEAGAHRYDYVKSILENWKANGGIKEKKEVKSNANRRNYKKNTGEGKSKWEGYKAPTPKLKRETDTTGLI
ncbi:DnaD domain protein [Clostridium caseinilyticum]|uniref:DnaD domain protein n=1 Tax=Clostridium caseinilyticum TaxID=3350403 RepID=UPI0038F6821B